MKAVDLLSGLLGQPAPQDAPPADGKFSALLAEAADQQSVTAKQQGAASGEGQQPLLTSDELPDAGVPGGQLTASRLVLPHATKGASALRGVRGQDTAESLSATGAQLQVALAPQLGAADAREIARATDALAATSVAHAEHATPEEAIANEALLGQVAAQLARIVAPSGSEPPRAGTMEPLATNPAAALQRAEPAPEPNLAAQRSTLAQQQPSPAQGFAAYMPQAGAVMSNAPQLQTGANQAPLQSAQPLAQSEQALAQAATAQAPTQTMRSPAQAAAAQLPTQSTQSLAQPATTQAQTQATATRQPQPSATLRQPQLQTAPTPLAYAAPSSEPRDLTGPQMESMPLPPTLPTPGGQMPLSQGKAIPATPGVGMPQQVAMPQSIQPRTVTTQGMAGAHQGARGALAQGAAQALATPIDGQALADDARWQVSAQVAAQAGEPRTQVASTSAVQLAPAETMPHTIAPALPQATTASLPQTTPAVPLSAAATRSLAATSTQALAQQPDASASGAQPTPQQGRTLPTHAAVVASTSRTQPTAWPSVGAATIPSDPASLSGAASVPVEQTSRAAAGDRLQTPAAPPPDAAQVAPENGLQLSALQAQTTQPSGARTRSTPPPGQQQVAPSHASGWTAQRVGVQPSLGSTVPTTPAVALPHGAPAKLTRGHVQAYGHAFSVPSEAPDGAPSVPTQTQALTQGSAGPNLEPRADGARITTAAETQPLITQNPAVSPSVQPEASATLGMQTPAPVPTTHDAHGAQPMVAPPPPAPPSVRVTVTTQPTSEATLEGAQQVAEGESASARSRGPGAKVGEDPGDRLQTFTRGAAVGSTLSAYGNRGHQGSHENAMHGRRDRDDREVVGTNTQSLEATARAFEQAAVHIQPAVEARAPEPNLRPQVPLPSPVQVPDLPDLEFARAPVQPENASISLQHPDLGPIQLQVHRNHGRVEVHALIESQHAEAVLRANESGIRYGVQQSGMTLGALRVRMRDGDDREQPTTRGAPVRRRRTSERQA